MPKTQEVPRLNLCTLANLKGTTKMDMVSGLGFVAALMTTHGFLPQVFKTWKTRSTKDISLGMFVVLVVGIILWITYGVLRDDLPLIIGNSITLLLVSIILFFKLRYK
jgi:MtN3 and saliva related transmembrane protein